MAGLLLLLAEGQVTGRGCSTKDKVFYRECETHQYGEQSERMCFCSFFLCNLSSPGITPPIMLIIGATLLTCVLNHSVLHHCQLLDPVNPLWTVTTAAAVVHEYVPCCDTTTSLCSQDQSSRTVSIASNCRKKRKV